MPFPNKIPSITIMPLAATFVAGCGTSEIFPVGQSDILNCMGGFDAMLVRESIRGLSLDHGMSFHDFSEDENELMISTSRVSAQIAVVSIDTNNIQIILNWRPLVDVSDEENGKIQLAYSDFSSSVEESCGP